MLHVCANRPGGSTSSVCTCGRGEDVALERVGAGGALDHLAGVGVRGGQQPLEPIRLGAAVVVGEGHELARAARQPALRCRAGGRRRRRIGPMWRRVPAARQRVGLHEASGRRRVVVVARRSAPSARAGASAPPARSAASAAAAAVRARPRPHSPSQGEPYSARVRVLAVGNMYPPHHFGGYELVWRSGDGPSARAGARGRGAHHRPAHGSGCRGRPGRPQRAPLGVADRRLRTAGPVGSASRWPATTTGCSGGGWPSSAPMRCPGGPWAGCRSP